MLTFTKEEIIPSTKLTRNFSEVLNKIKAHTLEKVVVLRNNEMEAIIIPYDEYENMKETMEIIEYRDIYETVKRRNKNLYKSPVR
ncbi:MAG: hypothetical protein A2015_15520 [Spirochaetes bacterium GWF1_31_7]|nr:MAG: hypothetical protein A2Y30_11940 [Spirochaetes bacterium GWE1_32_154]OHD47275.1 MAG: hypothetical protein A2Y29_02955 [Spirochaetes bacterium GWE2_31_10]OHD52147.1 MAG: hypothetical protein A2015_15520 [Spirochaetes bacterium GWF1_31_7]OHD81259.1 MAG: hypothetical protein A2355_03545 [Spirochaetes bacterium RIFOXYB1_FULL_32_8]HBD96331.1 prevent-host-death protein [Spirochaetia bacterium]